MSELPPLMLLIVGGVGGDAVGNLGWRVVVMVLESLSRQETSVFMCIFTSRFACFGRSSLTLSNPVPLIFAFA